MALFKCPDCGNEVSTQAAACPRCGRPNGPDHHTTPTVNAAPAAIKTPAAPASRATELPKKPSLIVRVGGTILFLFLLIGIGGAVIGNWTNGSVPSAAPLGPPAAASSTAPAAAPPPSPPSIDLSDAKSLDDKYGMQATSHCDSEADDYLRTIAKYDFKWDEDATGFMNFKFTKYRVQVSTPGVLTSVSQKAAMQNGFGAYQHITLLCFYDTQAEKVLGFEAQQ